MTGPGRHSPPRHLGRAAGDAESSQWAAWGFLAPASCYLLAFYAYPLYRNLDLSFRDYTVRSFVAGDAPFAGLAQLPHGAHRTGLRAGDVAHGDLHPRLDRGQFTIGMAPGRVLLPPLPAVAAAARAVPGAVAASADRVRVHLGMDVRQRLRHHQRDPARRSACRWSIG